VAGQVEQRLERGGEGDRAALSWHHLEAGQPERAMPHALAAAELAASRSAHADAARLYRRAIEAARASETPAAELVGVWEALGEALDRTGEPAAAHAAFTSGRALVVDDPLRVAELLYRHARVANRTGKITAAVRWVGRALSVVEGLEGDEAAGLRARLWSALAGVRLRQGRHEEAERSCYQAIADAERSAEERALAHACWLLDGTLVRQGRSDEATHSDRALEIYRRLGDRENLGRVLSNLGAFAVAAGDWDAGMELYEEGAEQAAQAGDVVAAAYGDCNIGETLSDQGRYDEAEPRLRRALQVWDGSGDEQGSGYARLLLGRMAVRVGRADVGRGQIERALRDLAALRCEFEADFARVLLAEAVLAGGSPGEALEMVADLVGAVDESPLLLRIRGLALAELGQDERAAEALREALDCARRCGSDFDAAAALDGLSVLADDPEAAAALAGERDLLLGRLGVRELPGPRVERPGGPLSVAVAREGAGAGTDGDEAAGLPEPGGTGLGTPAGR
jgi:tetratricopeptide (TPR) repeat protein